MNSMEGRPFRAAMCGLKGRTYTVVERARQNLNVAEI
jgi:hypothetical protein